MLSIIIPTLNEEKYLPQTLESIKNQNFKDYEIIVADAKSKDKTVEIAKKYGCVIVPGGMPAQGRNNGAKVAKGDTLFFLDADTVLPDGFFEKSLREFKKRDLKIAGFYLYLYPDKKNLNYLLDIIYRQKFLIAIEKKFPHSAVGILIERRLFEKLNGYDNSIRLAEDWDLVRRARKHGKFGIIESTEIRVSDRRIQKDGLIPIVVKALLCELHNVFLGPVTSDIFKYKFDHYEDKKVKWALANLTPHLFC